MSVSDVHRSLALYSNDLFHWFEDEFDYLVVHSQFDGKPQTPYLGMFSHVMNDTKGIGLEIFFNNRYASSGRLRGVIHFSGYTGVGEALLHELMHAWANFAVPTVDGSHWGFSSANGLLGGFDIAKLEELGEDRYAAGVFRTNHTGRVPYSLIELYLSGLMSPSEVPDLWSQRMESGSPRAVAQ